MGLYHGVDHYEQMKISDKSWTEPFVKGWPDLLQSQTVFRFAWSYIIAWVGVGMCLGSCVLFFMASMCIRSDKRREEAMNMQYLMPGNANFSKKNSSNHQASDLDAYYLGSTKFPYNSKMFDKKANMN